MKIFVIGIIAILLSYYTVIAQENEGTGSNPNATTEPVSADYQNKLDLGQIDPSVPLDVNDLCIEFFDNLKVKNYREAYQKLLEGGPLSRNKEKVSNQIDKTKEAVKLYGEILGFESAGSEYQSKSFLEVKFFSLHPFNPLLWTFTFYNSPTLGWIVLNLKLTDSV